MKKIVLVILMLVTSFIAKPLTGDMEHTNENVLNTTTENIIVDENKTSEKIEENADSNNSQIVNETTVEKNNKQEVNTSNAQKEAKSQVKEKNKVVQNSSSTANKTQSNPKQQKVEETTKNQTQQTTQQKQDNGKKQEEKIYCVDGGSHHLAGDGANEHGYYSSWESAYQAFKEYTKDWDSCQYKVDVCPCGLYYFWAIK